MCNKAPNLLLLFLVYLLSFHNFVFSQVRQIVDNSYYKTVQNFQGDFNKILLYKNSQVYSLEITKDNALIKPINIKGLSNVVSIDQNNKNKYVLTKKNEIALYDVQNLKIRKKIFSKTNIVFSKCVLNKSRILVFDDSFQIKIYDANSLVLLK